jgi:ABC-2 type transport system permease protein
MHTFNAVMTIGYRDFMKFVRDRPRIFSSFIFPFIFIAILGTSLQANVGEDVGYNFLVFVFVGVLAQTMFQSAAMGLISLIDDRDNDFSQAIFVAPISRYAIVFGKIAGESLVALGQGLGILLFAFILQIQLTVLTVIALFPAAVAVCLLGGAFGLIVMVNIKSRRGAEQIFPLLLLPQIFLSGVLVPINELPLPLSILSHLSPLRYAVDLMRGIFYSVNPAYTAEYDAVVLQPPLVNLVLMTAIFIGCMLVGTRLFVQGERNR